MTVLYDADRVLRANDMDDRHRHFVLSEGGVVEHRSNYGVDTTFQPVLDRLLGR